MNTSNATILPSSVGQLAKSGNILLKPSNNEALTVGRHSNKTTRASAHTREDAHDLAAMLHLNRLFSDLLPDTKVCYHNPLYVEQIEANYSKNESAIFLQFVKTFAQFRYQGCDLIQTQVVLTNETDFLNAFKLMRARKVAEYTDVKTKNKNKVLDLLKIKFTQRTFSAKILARELSYNYTLIDKIITLLLLEQQIEFVKEIAGQKTYRLRQKSAVHLCIQPNSKQC
jgi:hypothetical protein